MMTCINNPSNSTAPSKSLKCSIKYIFHIVEKSLIFLTEDTVRSIDNSKSSDDSSDPSTYSDHLNKNQNGGKKIQIRDRNLPFGSLTMI